jgi:hypothetical protein
MGLVEIEFGELKVQELFDLIKSFNKDYKKKTDKEWKDALDFVFSIAVNGGGVAALSIAIDAGTIFVTGTVQYFSHINKNNEIKARLIEGQAKIRTAITESKKNESKANNFVKRGDEICNYLEDAIKRYTIMFTEISAELFPKGDKLKAKSARKRRERKGEGYYTNDEMGIIMPIGK